MAYLCDRNKRQIRFIAFIPETRVHVHPDTHIMFMYIKLTEETLDL